MAFLGRLFQLVLRITPFITGVVSIISSVVNVVIKVVAGNKLFLTILLLGVAFFVWTFTRDNIDDLINYFVDMPSQQKINSSFLARIVNIEDLKTLVGDLFSMVVSYYATLTTGYSMRMILRFHHAVSDSIKV